MRPQLLASSRLFLSPEAEPREQDAKPTKVTAINDPSSVAESPYTCPMHPQIHEAQPGNCPICGMTLIENSTVPEGANP